MPWPFYDRVKETCVDVGAGPLLLGGAAPFGFITFSSVYADLAPFSYCIQMAGPDWEVGVGHMLAGSLVRDVIQASSNGNLVVNFPAGAKLVFNTFSADDILKTRSYALQAARRRG